MTALFLVRKGAHYLSGANGWGERSCASSFPEAQATTLAAEWTALAALPAGRCTAEPLDGDRAAREPATFAEDAGSILTNAAVEFSVSRGGGSDQCSR